MHLSKEELQKMEQMDIRSAVPDTLVDISEIDMKKSVSVLMNMRQILFGKYLPGKWKE